MCVEEKKLFTQAFETLRHGGWFEMTEMTLPLIFDNATCEWTALKSWNEDMKEASRKLDAPLQAFLLSGVDARGWLHQRARG